MASNPRNPHLVCALLAAVSCGHLGAAEIALPEPILGPSKSANPAPLAKPTPASAAPTKPAPKLVFGPSTPAPFNPSSEPPMIKPREAMRLEKAAEDAEGLLLTAKRAAERKDWQGAEEAYHRLLSLGIPPANKREALIEMGRFFEKTGAWAKAAIVYQDFLERFHGDPSSAEVMLNLGRTYRELGSFKLALSKFYDALHSSFASTAKQKEIALQAQFEIAQTHFAKGDYAEARRFFERLVLLEMNPDDKEIARYRLASTTFVSGDLGECVALSRQFIGDYPDGKNTAEVRYLLSRALQKLGRSEEAVRETLALLKETKGKAAKNAEGWRKWQKRTGTEVANELYQRGDAMGALTVYQRLAEMDADPAWRLPLVYQIGLCFERLRMTARALEAYAYIDKAELKQKNGTPITAVESATMIKEMAAWRMEYLRWSTDTDRKLGTILKPDWNSAGIQPLKFRETPVAPPGTDAGAE